MINLVIWQICDQYKTLRQKALVCETVHHKVVNLTVFATETITLNWLAQLVPS